MTSGNDKMKVMVKSTRVKDSLRAPKIFWQSNFHLTISMMMTSKEFQSKLAKIFNYRMRKNSETIKRHIFLIEHGAPYVLKAEGETDSIFAWIIVPTISAMMSRVSRLIIPTSSFMSTKR